MTLRLEVMPIRRTTSPRSTSPNTAGFSFTPIGLRALRAGGGIVYWYPPIPSISHPSCFFDDPLQAAVVGQGLSIVLIFLCLAGRKGVELLFPVAGGVPFCSDVRELPDGLPDSFSETLFICSCLLVAVLSQDLEGEGSGRYWPLVYLAVRFLGHRSSASSTSPSSRSAPLPFSGTLVSGRNRVCGARSRFGLSEYDSNGALRAHLAASAWDADFLIALGGSESSGEWGRWRFRFSS
jgi:hypothetical protein